MSIRKIFMVASAVALSLSANAQLLPTVQEGSALKANIYNRNISRFNILNQTDKQIQEIGERYSANGLPSKASAAKMLKSAKRNIAAMRKMAMKAPAKAKYTAADTLFFESFEGWEGETMPWIPTEKNNWSVKSNVENLTPYISDGGCPTWTVYEGDGYYAPYATDGYQYVVCMFGDDVYTSDGKNLIAKAPQQDEWLVSPTVNSINGTNILSFDINYSAWHTHYFIEGTDSVFDTSRVAYDLEVLVTTSTRSASYDASKYTSVYKLSTEVDKEIATINMDNPEDVAKLIQMRWRHVQIPLKEFEGNNIRIAFRYTGSKGGTVLIDGIRVSDLLPVAVYDRPEGSFFLGFANDGTLLNNGASYARYVLMPAYRESVWTNYSNNDVLDFEWRYNVNGESGTSKERDLVMPASRPSDFTAWPTLQANAGLRSDVYNGGQITGVRAGGDGSLYIDPSVGSINFGLGNFDLEKGTSDARIGNDASAFGTGGGAFWSNVSDGYYVAVDGIANVFDTPTAPYVFNQVSQVMEDYFNLGKNLACTIYRARDLGEGQLVIEDEVIAQSTNCTDNAVKGGGHVLVFNFDEALVIDCPIAISIDGFDDFNVITARPLIQALNHDSDKGYSFALLKNARGGVEWVEVASALAALEGSGNWATSFCMAMNAVFPFLKSTDGDVFTVANEGGEQSFNVDTYWNPNGAGEGAVDAGWKITCSDSWFKAVSIVDEANMTVSVKITADALPASVEGRTGTVKITALGCEETITVTQGATGINSISANNFSNLNGTYTLSGQRINSADAKHGIFLEKKNGKFVKVMK